MAARKTQQETIPPTLSPHQAIPLLQRQIERLEQQIIALPPDHPDVEAWTSTTTNILNQAFGQPNGERHSKTLEFVHADSGLPIQVPWYGEDQNPEDIQRRYVLKQAKRKALLNAF